MLTDDEIEMLGYWDQAGERPYEMIIDVGLTDVLHNLLNRSYFSLNVPLYRGTTRNLDLDVGDIKEYDYPSSWSTERKIASYFIDGVEGVIIVIDKSDIEIHAIVNNQNTYDEREVIVSPIRLQVTNKNVCRNITYIHTRVLQTQG